MADPTPESPVRIIGSRELHQNLPGILKELERSEVRYVLTVHGKPRAVLIGAQPYLDLVQDNPTSSEALASLQLSALLGVPDGVAEIPLEDLEKAVDSKRQPSKKRVRSSS